MLFSLAEKEASSDEEEEENNAFGVEEKEEKVEISKYQRDIVDDKLVGLNIFLHENAHTYNTHIYTYNTHTTHIYIFKRSSWPNNREDNRTHTHTHTHKHHMHFSLFLSL